MEKLEILLQILTAFAVARLMGRLFVRLGLPSVVGELAAGAVLGPHLLNIIEHSQFMDSFSELGLIILLFVAGLETHLRELFEVQKSAVKVALLGLLFPFVLGYLFVLPFGYPLAENLFVATALVATSVGITVRVLRELGHSQRKSAKIILGAAVLDDILGLIVLVIVKGIALGKLNLYELVLLAIEAVLFVGSIAYFGPRLVKYRSSVVSKLPSEFLFELSVILMLGLSFLAEYIGLAAIVGAFLAGLMLSESKEFTKIHERFVTLSWFFVPFFFVLMGTYVDLKSFAKPLVLLETLVFTAAAIVSKYIGGYLGSIKEKRQTAREVGVGMIPRGEVGIVIAGIALAAGAIELNVYTSVIGMVVLTTVISPFLIKYVYGAARTK